MSGLSTAEAAGARAAPGRRRARRAERRIRSARADRLYDAANVIALAVVALGVLYPLVYIVSSSFSNPAAVTAGRVWLWPVEPSLIAYERVYSYPTIWRGYANTLFYTSFGTIISVALTLLAAYPVSRRRFRGRNLYMLLFVFTMIFDGGIIPTYLVVRGAGMINTRWAMLIPTAVAAWNVIITRTFFQVNVPDELLEAAQIDGSSDLQFFWHVVLPISGAIIAVNTLFYAVYKWNSFFEALLYLNDERLVPLQIVLRNILIVNSMDASLFAISAGSDAAQAQLRALIKFAVIVVASVPVLMLYPFVQKYFVRGVLIGSLKG